MNTDDKNMTTQDLIKHLRQLMPLGPQIATLVNVAADRLEELQRERDEARAQVERLKQKLHEARIENSGQAAQLERTRPEPSRLEIAAMWISGFAGFNNFNAYTREHVIEQAFINADALIAAARGAE
jgi:hypothetical protein